MLDVILAAFIGIFVGGLLNILADELPYRTFFSDEIKPHKGATKEELAEYEKFNKLLKIRNKLGYNPVYPDGTPRPMSAWLGITAFALGQRLPENPQPNEVRARGHREDYDWKLSWRHPLTEIMTSIFFGLAAFAADSIPDMNTAQYLMNFAYMTFFSLIIAIDMEHKLILFVVMIPAIILAFIDAFFISPPLPSFRDALIGAALGFSVFFAIYLLGFGFRWVMNTFAGRNINTVAFGYGDVILITFSGAVLGTLWTIVAIGITTLLGAIGALLYLIVKAVVSGTNATMTALPYGPYIVIATLIMLLWGHQIGAIFVG